MNVNFNGFGEDVATFAASAGLNSAGVPVKISGDGTVAKCAKNDNFCGVCRGVRDGYATVQLSGYVTMNTISKIEPGYKKLTASDNNLVMESTTGREYLVLDSTASTVGFIL